jgi:hypothetical protein
VLREIVDAERLSATALIAKDEVQKFQTQRNGGPMFPVNLVADVKSRGDDSVVRALQDNTFSTINPDYRDLVKGALALNYRVDTGAKNNEVACPYQGGDINTMLYAKDFSFAGLLAEADPRCRPLDDYYISKELLGDYIGVDQGEMMYRLQTSNGIYGDESFDADGNRITVTPGIFVGDITAQALESGYTQLENANDVGQIVDALYASMGDQAITNGGSPSASYEGLSDPSGGLSSLVQSSPGGAGNLLDQILANNLNNLKTTINNGAIQALRQLLDDENGVVADAGTVVNTINGVSAQLAGNEKNCFAGSTGTRAAQAISSNFGTTTAQMTTAIAAAKQNATVLTNLINSNTVDGNAITAALSANNIPDHNSLSSQRQQLSNLNSQAQQVGAQLIQQTTQSWQSQPGVLASCGT